MWKPRRCRRSACLRCRLAQTHGYLAVLGLKPTWHDTQADDELPETTMPRAQRRFIVGLQLGLRLTPGQADDPTEVGKSTRLRTTA